MNTKQTRSKWVFLLAFVLPALSLLTIFAIKGIYPFGGRSFLRTDMYHQYAPFHAQLAEMLQNGESLLYSWEVGAGSNFISLFAYYLCSPFNLLLFFITKAGIVEYTSYMVVLKTGLAGLTMAYYLCRKFDTRSVSAAFFAMAYGLSGYMAAYSWNIMWLDCIWLAPLVLLGLELLVEENKGLMYCITLTLSILTNYYISIMLCMFLVLYFICLIIMYPSKKSNEIIGQTPRRVRDYVYKCLLFAFYSLLAGGLAAVLILPVASALKTMASSNVDVAEIVTESMNTVDILTGHAISDIPKTLTSYFTTLDMLARHMVGVETEIGLEHWPNLYSCAAIFLLAPLYIMNKNIPYKEKIVKCFLLLGMLVSFAWNIPNFVWHGFHFPNSLPCRQSFLYTIILLTMCFEALHNLRSASVAQIVGSLWGAIAFIFFCEQTVDAPEIRFYVYYINICVVGVHGLLLYLYKRRKLPVPILAVLAFAIVFAEMTANMGITSITTTSRSAYLSHTEDFSALSQWAQEEEGSNFFRMEKTNKKTKNDGAWAGYRSASIFSSSTNAAITKVYKQLGMEGSTNAYSFTGATPFVSSLLSVKYTLTTDELGGPLTTLVQTSGAVNLYRNDHTLPLGFMIPSSATNWNNDPNPISVQNAFISNTTSISTIYTHVTSGNSSNYTYTSTQDGYYYGVLTDFSVKNIKATYSDDHTTTYSNVNRDFILDFGYMKAGEQVTLTSDDKKVISVNVYRLLEDNYTEAVAQLNAQPLVITSYSNTEIQATIDVKEAGILFTSIPYEEGWTVRVNGIPVQTTAYADAFISIDLSEGQHTITMTYVPVGLHLGAMISLGSLAILLILIIIHLARRGKSKHQAIKQKKQMRIPVTESAEAKPSPEPVQVSEDVPAEEPEEITLGNIPLTLPPLEEIPQEMEPIPVETPVEEETIPVAPTKEEEMIPVASAKEEEINPRLLAFEQLMKDLGGRIQ